METITRKEWMTEARKLAKKAGKDGMALGVSLRAKHLIVAEYEDRMVVKECWKLMMRGCA